ncbi:MAG: PEP-CTERM sorting domain-containing protein [Planctomycetota bacterium]|jgi:hypothetical protein
MKPKKQIWFAVFLFVSALLAQTAAAVPVGDKDLCAGTPDVTCSIGFGAAQVDCEVYEYTSDAYAGKYLYTYQISNVDSGIGLKFFSVGIMDAANAYDADCDVPDGAIAPALWASSGSSYKSVDAQFTVAITEGQSSAILWYISDYAPGAGPAALFGTYSGMPYYATADVLAPVPEPAGICLLGIGAALMAVIRKKPHV